MLILLLYSDVSFSEPKSILRYLARVSSTGLYGSNALQQTEVDYWVDFALTITDESSFQAQAEAINKHLSAKTFFLGNQPSFSLADVVVFASISGTICYITFDTFVCCQLCVKWSI